MKERREAKMEDYPEVPPWTMFFDGPLYQKYDEFMKNKDFSKILLNTKLRLANSTTSGADIVSSTFSTEDDRWEKDQDDPTGSTWYQYVTPDYYKRSREEEKRRTRRTRAFILLGILVMAALAFGTALVIHYFFVPSSEDRNPANIVNVSFSMNTTDDFPAATTTEDVNDEILQLLDVLPPQDDHTHHDHDHEHILNPDGKIFDETFKPSETTTFASDESTLSDTTTPSSTTTLTMTTETTTAATGATESAVYELHLIPDTSSSDTATETKTSPSQPTNVNTTTTSGSRILDSISPNITSKPVTSTMELDHMDFFAMDDLFPANTSSSTPSYDYDFFAMDVTDNITEPTSTAAATIPTTSVTQDITSTTKDILTTEGIQTTENVLNDTELVTNTMGNVLTSTTAVNETTTEDTATDSTTTSPTSESTEPAFGTSMASTEESVSTVDVTTTDGTQTTTEDSNTVDTTTEVTSTGTVTKPTTDVIHRSNQTTDTSLSTPAIVSMTTTTNNVHEVTDTSTIAETTSPMLTFSTTNLTESPSDKTTLGSSTTSTAYLTTSPATSTRSTTTAYLTTSPATSIRSTTAAYLTTSPAPSTRSTTTAYLTTSPATSIRSTTTAYLTTSPATSISSMTTPYLTTTPATTTLPPDISTITMEGMTTYMYEIASLDCTVKHAVRWQSLSIRVDQKWRPLEVTVHPSGLIEWSRSKKPRHDVTYDVTNSTDGRGSDIHISLIIHKVQCKDAETFICTLKSAYPDKMANSKLVVVGKPSNSIKLTMGPSTIEDQALRITASWQGGYPVPWTNMSWTAIDTENKSYNLEKYGEYRDRELHEDHQFCQTTLKHSIVIFPKLHLNGTRIIVKPDIQGKRYFVDKEMEKYLLDVKPGEDEILVIPNDYCGNDVKKEKSMVHPYTACSKFVLCLPANMFVQLCPFGTCFYEKIQECA